VSNESVKQFILSVRFKKNSTEEIGIELVPLCCIFFTDLYSILILLFKTFVNPFFVISNPHSSVPTVVRKPTDINATKSL